jgi:hypothetical protein
MAKKKEKSQPPETPKSTEEEVTVPSELFDEMVGGLRAEAESTAGPLEDHPDKFGALAPADSDMAIALQHEGINPAFLARKLKIILSAYEPKWNQGKRRWDYFIPSELWRRCIEMSMKVRGDYAPEKRIDINIDGSLEDLLRVSKGVTPEEAKAKIIEYIDVEVIKGK